MTIMINRLEMAATKPTVAKTEHPATANVKLIFVCVQSIFSLYGRNYVPSEIVRKIFIYVRFVLIRKEYRNYSIK